MSPNLVPRYLVAHNALEQLEVRAFGCLIEELLELSKHNNKDENIKEGLFTLQMSCFNERPSERPLFKQILQHLNE